MTWFHSHLNDMFDFDNAGVDFGDITMDAEGVFTGVGYAGSIADIIALH